MDCRADKGGSQGNLNFFTLRLSLVCVDAIMAIAEEANLHQGKGSVVFLNEITPFAENNLFLFPTSQADVKICPYLSLSRIRCVYYRNLVF